MEYLNYKNFTHFTNGQGTFYSQPFISLLRVFAPTVAKHGEIRYNESIAARNDRVDF